MKSVVLALAMLFLLCSFSYAAGNGEEVTVTGKLTQVFAIGGETTGWALELDSPLKIEGKELKLIEIDLCGKKINLFPFEGDTMKVTGNLVKHQGVERGSYWVIEVRTFSW